MIGGSPCTHWSIAQTKNRETKAEGIGWELFKNYLYTRDKYKPDYFLYENNKSMSKAIREQISEEFGFEPDCINSALVSAQSRQRLYWVGKRNEDGTYSRVIIPQPEDRGILLRDILETEICWKEKSYTLDSNYYKTLGQPRFDRQSGRRGMVAEPVEVKPLSDKEMEYMVRETSDGRNHFDYEYYHDATKDKSSCVTANTYKGVPYNVLVEPVRVGTIENSAKNADFDSQQYRVYSVDGKSVTLCGNGGGVGAKTGLYVVPVDYEEQVPISEQRPIQVGILPNKQGDIKNTQSKRIYSVDAKGRNLCASEGSGNSDTASPATGLYAVEVDVGEYEFQQGDSTENSKIQFLGGFIKDGKMWLNNGKHYSRNFNQGKRLHGVDGKATTLTASGCGIVGNSGLYAVPEVIEADYSVIDGAEIYVSNGKIRQGDQAGSKQGKYVYTSLAEKSNVITAGQAHNEKVLEQVDNTSGFKNVYDVFDEQITINGKQYPIKLRDGKYIIRKLTVNECKRLQTVPEYYVFPVSDTQAYKMLGNGWTCDVISHLLSYCDGVQGGDVEVFSMYDGMSCGHIALDNLGANITKYFATEIDKYAIQTTQENYPDTIQLGDAFQVRDDAFWDKLYSMGLSRCE